MYIYKNLKNNLLFIKNYHSEMPILNVFDKLTKNEEVYFSFLKNLLFVFNELNQIEGIYSTSISRVLYFLNLNEKAIDEYPALQMRKILTNYLEKTKNSHCTISKKYETFSEEVQNLLTKDIQKKEKFETAKKENVNKYESIRKDYNELKNTYNDQCTNIAKQYSKMHNMKEEELTKEKTQYDKAIQEAIKTQNEWQETIKKSLNLRVETIQERRAIVKEYKDNNKNSLEQCYSILKNYYEMLKEFHSESLSKIEILNTLSKDSITKQYENIFDDISDWSDPQKYEFIPFTSGNDVFFKNCTPENCKKSQTEFAKELKAELEKYFAYEPTEYKISDDYRKINTIANKSIEGKENITSEELDLVCKTNEYILFFLRILNKKRSSLIDINEISFMTFKTIMEKTLDKIEKDTTKKDNPEQYFEIIEYVMILSQTFYAIINGERVLLQDHVCTRDFWKNKDVWIDTIKFHIAMEREKQRIDDEKNYDVREEKAQSIATSAFTTYYFNMNAFKIDQPIRDEVKKVIEDYYHIPTDIINALDSN